MIADRPAAPPQSWSVGFPRGFTAVWRGFTYLCSNPTLWRYGVIPVLLNLVITTVVLILLLTGCAWALTKVHDFYADGAGYIVLEIVVGVIVIVVAVILALVVWKVLEGVLCGIFYERLARKVELRLGTPESELKDITFADHVVDTVRGTLKLLGVNIGLLALHIVPVLGSVAAMVGAFYFNWWLLGMEFLDYPLGLRGLRRSEKNAFARRHRPPNLGLGAAVLLLGFIPVVGAVFLTTAVVGAVLLYHEIEDTARAREKVRRG